MATAAGADWPARRRLRAACGDLRNAAHVLYRQRRRVALFLGPWLVAIGIAVPLLWYQIEAGHRDARVGRSQDVLHSAEDTIRRVLDRLGRDILFLGVLAGRLSEAELRPGAIGSQLFMSFAASAPDYDQVRWIDANGQERLRVDQKAGVVTLVPEGQLQDTSSLPYFLAARELPAKGLYFSALGPKVERGVVEVPSRPLLRVATPLEDAGARRGVLVLNYAARSLLDRIHRIAGTDPSIALFVVNADGYWVTGPPAGPDGAWPRGGSAQSLAHTHPDLWAALRAGAAGQMRGEAALWLFRRLELGHALLAAREASAIVGPGTLLYLVVRLDSVHGEPGEAQAKIVLSVLAFVLTGMVLVVALRLAQSLEREAAQTRALTDANSALTEANRHLAEVQQEIARAERLSSLGLMVAGVAHELNTPLGVATLSLSRAQDGVAALESRMAAGLRRSELASFIAASHGDIAIAQDALRRCADLVRRFKQVAVDRATIARRRMDLADTIVDADPRLRKWDASGGVTLSCALQGGLEMDSYPGPLQQVVSNLLGNALKHAFPEGRAGTIRIRARAEGAHSVRIEVEDDGVGIPPPALARVFEPFFTTARARGGTGLGLHIVHQIVTELLGGRITVASPPPGAARGSLVTLILPKVAPEPRATGDGR